MTPKLTRPLSDLSCYVYGTTRLGDESISFPDRVAIAREAIQAKLWIHTSHQYGDALNVIRAALDEDRTAVPAIIFKIGHSTSKEVEGQVMLQIEALNIGGMSIGQLCPSGPLAEDLCNGGPGVAELQTMKSKGLVGRFVMEAWPWTSDIAIRTILAGHADGLIEGYIFYLNPLQRFVTNKLWDLLLERDIPIVAMRTVAGGNVMQTLANPNAPNYLKHRAGQIAPIFAQSGISSWTEFAARYSLGFAQVRATVGATARSANLSEFIAATHQAKPLPDDLVKEILILQREWSDTHDQHAAPWSM